MIGPRDLLDLPRFQSQVDSIAYQSQVDSSAYQSGTSPLPTDAKERKDLPLWTYMFNYFPLAWLAEVRVAVAGDKQHKNEGKTIQWAREKSADQLNTAYRHLFDYGMGNKYDADGEPHLAKAIWRLKAQLQLDEEARK